MRPHVALITPGFRRDLGDEVFPSFSCLVDHLSDRVQVSVIPLRYPPSATPYRIGDVKVWPMAGDGARGVRRVVFLRRARRWFAKLHDRERFHVAHGLCAHEPGALASCFAPRRVASVVSVMGGEFVDLSDVSYGGQRNLIDRHLSRQCVARADVVTTGNARETERVRRWRAGPIVEMVFGHDGRWFHPGANPATGGRALHGSPAFLSVAGFTAVKDHATLLRAFALVVNDMPNAGLNLVGDGPCPPAIIDDARELGIGHAVTVHRPRPHREMAGLYRRADALVVSSRHETGPVVALEAAACGCRIVGTAVGRMPDFVDPARLAEPGDAAGLARAMGAAATLGGDDIAKRVAAHELGITVERLVGLYDSLAAISQ